MNKILTLHKDRDAVHTYRIHRFLDNIPNKSTRQNFITRGRKILSETARILSKKGDVWLLKYIDSDPNPNKNWINILLSARKLCSSKIIVDIDDNIFKIPLKNPAFWEWTPQRKAGQEWLLRHADYLIASTRPLYDYLKSFNDKVVLFPNCIDENDWKGFKKLKNDKVRIGWIFSRTHVADMKVIDEALGMIMEEFKDKVEFYLIGGTEGLFDFDYHYTNGRTFKDYPKLLEEANLDISIAPLAINEFNNSKSNIKWLESTMAGAAFVGSNIYPYEHSIINGKTGFVCGSKNQWVNALRKLIKDEKLRKEMVSNAKKVVLKDYNIKDWSKKYHQFIECL